MKLGIYLNLNGTGPLVLVAFCTVPALVAEHLYGPLTLRGAVETDDPTAGVDWPLLVAQILDTSYTTVERKGVGRFVLSAITEA